MRNLKRQTPSLSSISILRIPLGNASGWPGVVSRPNPCGTFLTAEGPYPARGSILPYTTSPHSTEGSSLGRLNADPGRSHSLWGAGTLLWRTALENACLNTHFHTPSTIPGRRQPSCPVPMMVWQGSPALEHVLLLHTRQVVRFLLPQLSCTKEVRAAYLSCRVTSGDSRQKWTASSNGATEGDKAASGGFVLEAGGESLWPTQMILFRRTKPVLPHYA